MSKKRFELICYRAIYREEIEAETLEEAWEIFGEVADKQYLDSGDEDNFFKVIEIDDEELEEDEDEDYSNVEFVDGKLPE